MLHMLLLLVWGIKIKQLMECCPHTLNVSMKM